MDTLAEQEVRPSLMMGELFGGKLITEFGAQPAKAAGQLSGVRWVRDGE